MDYCWGMDQFGKNSTVCYFSTSAKLIDQFQQLCLHAGWTSVITTAIEKGHKSMIRGKRNGNQT